MLYSAAEIKLLENRTIAVTAVWRDVLTSPPARGSPARVRRFSAWYSTPSTRGFTKFVLPPRPATSNEDVRRLPVVGVDRVCRPCCIRSSDQSC